MRTLGKKLDGTSVRTRLHRRMTATVVGCVALTVSTALVAATTIARAVDCSGADSECTQCSGRLRLYYALMLAFSIMFIASLTGLLVGRFILFPAPLAIELHEEEGSLEESLGD